jgi:2-dehydro-3-deoxygluconokinase
MSAMAPPRVVCLGETMMMFAPPPHELIEYCDTFQTFHGGAESNVAIGLERLGLHAGWVSKLPDNALGRKVANEVRSFGADTSAVVWTNYGRVGTFFFEWGAPPRPLMTIYDRANSVYTTLTADELDWDYIRQAEWLTLTGITPALSPTCRQMALDVVQRARACGLRVAMDMNYRSLLWERDEAASTCRELLPHLNLLVGTEPDMRMLCGTDDSQEDLLNCMARTYGIEIVTMTLGEGGCLAWHGGVIHRAGGHPVQTVNRLGAGDAFFAGLLYGVITANVPTALRYGMAMSALKLTIPQNIPLINKADVLRLMDGSQSSLVR